MLGSVSRTTACGSVEGMTRRGVVCDTSWNINTHSCRSAFWLLAGNLAFSCSFVQMEITFFRKKLQTQALAAH